MAPRLSNAPSEGRGRLFTQLWDDCPGTSFREDSRERHLLKFSHGHLTHWGVIRLDLEQGPFPSEDEAPFTKAQRLKVQSPRSGIQSGYAPSESTRCESAFSEAAHSGSAHNGSACSESAQVSLHTVSLHAVSLHTESAHSESAHSGSSHNESAHSESAHSKSTHSVDLHTVSLHTISLHTVSLHTMSKSLHNESVHSDSVHSESVHSPNTVLDTDRRHIISKSLSHRVTI